MWNEPTVLIGVGGHAKSVAAVMQSVPYRLLQAGDDGAFVADYSGENVVVTIGYVGDGAPESSARRRVIDFYERAGVSFGTVVASSAIVAPSATIADGSVVLARAVVNADADVGRHCVINTGAIVEHDVVLGKNVNLAPGAIVLGAAKIGENTFVGAGAVVAQEVFVCSNVVIGVGSFVRRDVVESGVYCGNPLRRIR